MSALSKIICVSNRLPISATEENGQLEIRSSTGGLVTAMDPILRKSKGVWIGWTGVVSESSTTGIEEKLSEYSSQSEFELVPVVLDQDSVSGFYQGFSNQIIWPLFHDLQTRCDFEPNYWSTYLQVQQKFADAVANRVSVGDLIWVHDFHLMGLGRSLRQMSIENKIGFFLHIPFPGPDIFLKLPWRSDVIESMLSYDQIGFQTKRDLNNFVSCLKELTGTSCSTRGNLVIAKTPRGECQLGFFPISIDYDEFDQIARTEECLANVQKLRADMNTEFLILSIDRLDYTKGVPYRIRAFKQLLEKEPSLKKRIALLQVVVPSRIEVPEYKQLRSDIERMVSELNGEFAEPGWVPVHHLFRSLTREEVITMYRASDVALVAPLKDGMNLVAKEYCVSQVEDGGLLVLSEFAGAADELAEHAFLVNPYDIDGVANALSQAINTPKEIAQQKMQSLQDIILKSDVFYWAGSFLNSLGWEWDMTESTPRPATFWSRLRRLTNFFEN